MGYGENNRASRGYLVDLLSQKGLQVGSGFEASPRFSVSCQGCGIKGLFRRRWSMQFWVATETRSSDNNALMTQELNANNKQPRKYLRL